MTALPSLARLLPRLRRREGRNRQDGGARLHAGPSGTVRSVLSDLVLIAGAVALVWISILVLLQQQRAEALHVAEHDSAGVALSLEQATDRHIADIDRVLRSVRAACGSIPASCQLDAWDGPGGLSPDPTPWLSITGPHGRVLNRQSGSDATSIAGAPEFVGQRDATGDEMMMGRAPGPEHRLRLTRRLHPADPAFAGVVVATVTPPVLVQPLPTLLPGSITLLAGRDGTVQAAWPGPERLLGQSIANLLARAGKAGRLLQPGEGGTVEARGPGDGLFRIYSFRRLTRYDMIVAVGVGEGEVFAAYRRNRIAYVVGGTVLSLLLLRFGLVLISHKRRLVQSQTALTDTLENISQGVVMVAADRFVPVMNRRAMELLDLPPNLTAGNCSFDDILQWQLDSGEFGPGGRGSSNFRRFVESGGIDAEYGVYERTRANGRTLEIRTQRLANGGAVRTYTDITERKAARARITYLAHHDGLTGLANRSLFQDRLARAIREAAGSGCRFAVLCLDLDRFKLVNDLRGHDAGDRLLVQVAERLRRAVGPNDTVARLGGDEFAVVQTAYPDWPDAPATLAEALAVQIGEPYEVDGHHILLRVSIGIALYPADGATGPALLKSADTALYRAKEGGRGKLRFFAPDMVAHEGERRLLETELREALARGQLSLSYQPICGLPDRRVQGFEALMRWDNPRRGEVPPGEFIPVAEETGLIVELGLWALETACTEATGWPSELRVSVNLSPVQFLMPDLPLRIADILARTGLPPGRLSLEITEGVLIADSERVPATMQALQDQGIRLALDDFGTGHASLSYLRRYPFDTMKVDKTFVQGLVEDEQCRAILRAVMTLGHGMMLDVVAEGVETEAQVAILERLGCRQVQGYLFGRPLLPAQVAALLAATAARAVPGHRAGAVAPGAL